MRRHGCCARRERRGLAGLPGLHIIVWVVGSGRQKAHTFLIDQKADFTREEYWTRGPPGGKNVNSPEDAEGGDGDESAGAGRATAVHLQHTELKV
jgi:hypothetical protein